MDNPLNSSGIFSQDFRHCRFFRKTQTDSRERNIEPEKFTDRIIFMSMFNDIDWTRKGHDGICVSNWEKVTGWAKRFSQGHWTFVGPGDEKKWYGTLLYTSEGKWDSTATQMVERFKDTRHPVFKSISALSRGIMKKKHNRDTIHFNADASNTELLFRIVHSVNQLRIYGAVSNWCEQFRLDRGRKGKRKTERIRDQRCLDKCEITRSGTFGFFSKTSIWKQFVGNHSGLRITVRDSSIHKGMRRRIVPAQGLSWCGLQNSTWRGRRFWACHSIVQTLYVLSSKHPIQSLCSNSRRNSVWASHWSSDLENLRPRKNPSSNETKRTSYDLLISRGKSRFVDEVQILNSELRSSAGLLIELQKAGREKSWLGQSKTGIQETGCGPCFTCADTLSIPPSQSSFFQHTQNHSYDREELDSYSCQFFVWRSSANSRFKKL